MDGFMARPKSLTNLSAAFAEVQGTPADVAGRIQDTGVADSGDAALNAQITMLVETLTTGLTLMAESLASYSTGLAKNAEGYQAMDWGIAEALQRAQAKLLGP